MTANVGGGEVQHPLLTAVSGGITLQTRVVLPMLNRWFERET